MRRYSVLAFLLLPPVDVIAADPPKKSLPLPGEVFDLAGRTAFLIAAPADPHATAKPWVWYAPTLPNLPGIEEAWMFERFRSSGVAVAGIDAGETYGSPAGNAVFDTIPEPPMRHCILFSLFLAGLGLPAATGRADEAAVRKSVTFFTPRLTRP